MEPGASCQCARAERAVAVDEIQVLQVSALEVEVPADAVAEQGQMTAQVAQRLPDRLVQLSPLPCRMGPPDDFVSYDMISVLYELQKLMYLVNQLEEHLSWLASGGR